MRLSSSPVRLPSSSTTAVVVATTGRTLPPPRSSTNNNNDSDDNDDDDHADRTVYEDLVDFLQVSPSSGPNVRLEAVKAVLQVVTTNRDDALKLIQRYHVLQPMLKLVSAGNGGGGGGGGRNSGSGSGSSTAAAAMEEEASEVALQTLLYLTSSSEQSLVNLCTDQLLTTTDAVPRLVEFVLSLPLPHLPTVPTVNDHNDHDDDDHHGDHIRRKTNLALAVLANLSRTEAGAVALTGFALPQEAVYNTTDNNTDNNTDTNNNNNNKETNRTRIKPTMELLLDRFLNPYFVDVGNQEIVDYSMMEPHEWDALFYDPYQHFAAILMNITQTPAGRQFILRIPSPRQESKKMKVKKATKASTTETTTNGDGKSPSNQTTTTSTTTTTTTTTSATSRPPPLPTVLERLVPMLRNNNHTTTSTIDDDNKSLLLLLARNPLRRRGVSGLIRNILCENPDTIWWLLNVVKILTPLLLPLAGPEELDWEDRRGMDPDLWLDGPDQLRDVDVTTRQHCVESILLLCATGGRKARETLRLARTYVILRQADLVEESSVVSERIEECVQYLRRDEEGTAEGSSDRCVEEVYGSGSSGKGGDDARSDDSLDGRKVPLAIEMAPSTCVTMGVSEEDFDQVD